MVLDLNSQKLEQQESQTFEGSEVEQLAQVKIRNQGQQGQCTSPEEFKQLVCDPPEDCKMLVWQLSRDNWIPVGNQSRKSEQPSLTAMFRHIGTCHIQSRL